MIQFELHLISLTNSENMAAVKPSIKDILCLEKIPIILGKSYEIEAFVMGHHVYKQTWTPFVEQKLDAAMQPSNIKDKYAVAIFQGGRNSHWSSSSRKVGEVCEDNFLFSKSSQRKQMPNNRPW